MADKKDDKKAETKTETKKTTAPSPSHFSNIEHALLAASKGDQKEREVQVVQRFMDLGLGRGIDATRNTPWIDKPSVQIRPLVFDRLIGTEEGGAVTAYETDVASVQSLQLTMKQSVTAPTTVPVKIGMDSEASRTVSTSRRCVGRRVLNRTISFKEEFDSVPRSTIVTSPEGGGTTHVDAGIAASLHDKRDVTFEEKLAHWLMDRLVHEADSRRAQVDQVVKKPLQSAWDDISSGKSSSVDEFEKCFLSSPLSDDLTQRAYDITRQWLFELCLSFINHFSATHYVSAIKLGAIEYSVMSEEQFLSTVSQAGMFGLDSIVSFVFKVTSTKKNTNKYSELRRIGRIKNPETGDYFVPRGTYSEAVIGCEMKSIHNLVRHTQLRRIVQVAISKYIDKQRDSSVGPFRIVSDSLNSQAVYFCVDKNDLSLRATVNKSEASEFFIIHSDKGTLVQDFHIIYAGPQQTGTKTLLRTPTLLSFGAEETRLQNLPYYLSTPLNLFGNNHGPVYFNLHPDRYNTLFVLQSRLRTNNTPPEALEPWLQGREGFFINCHKRRLARDGYLSIRVAQDGSVTEYVPCCVPSKGASSSHLMVFRLIKAKPEHQNTLPSPDDLTPLPVTEAAVSGNSDLESLTRDEMFTFSPGRDKEGVSRGGGKIEEAMREGNPSREGMDGMELRDLHLAT